MGLSTVTEIVAAASLLRQWMRSSSFAIKESSRVKPLDKRLLTYAKDTRKYIALLGLTGSLAAILVIAQSLLISGSISPVIDGSRNTSASWM